MENYCNDKVVLDIGCWGDPRDNKNSPTHFALKAAAKECIGVDRAGTDPTNPEYVKLDIETGDWDVIPDKPWDFVVATEILEHLKNPGIFMDNLKRFDCPIIITTPNPWTHYKNYMIALGVENTSYDHLNHISYVNFLNLCRACGWFVHGFAYWGPQGDVCFLSKGFIFIIGKEPNAA